MIRSYLFLFLSLVFATTPLFMEAQEGKPNFAMSINVGNLLIARPQISVEKSISTKLNAELTIGYIFANQFLQNKTVLIHGNDAYLSTGFHAGIGIKNYLSEKVFMDFHTLVKSHGYQSKVWNNGETVSIKDQSGMEYITSNQKLQIAVLFGFGTNRYFANGLFYSVYGAMGLQHNSQEWIFEEKIYDHTIRFIDEESTPFSESISHLQPYFQLGVKLGFHKK